MKTIFWGKYFWYCIHLTALGYPENPNHKDKLIYKQFYLCLGKILPCPKCSANFVRHLITLPIDSFLQNRQMLFKWTVYMHNIVNKEIGKPQWNVEYAEAYYKTYQYINDTQIKNVNNQFINDSEVKNINNTNAKENNFLIIFVILNVIIILIVFFIIFRYKIILK